MFAYQLTARTISCWPTNRPESSHPRAMYNEGYNYAHAWLKLLVQDSAPMKFNRP